MKLNTLALALLLTPLAGSALAEVTFTPFATYRHFDEQTIEKLSGTAVTPDIQGKEGYGLSLGYRFTPAFGLEAHFARTETDIDTLPIIPGFNGQDIRADRLSLDGYYTFNAEGKFSPYVLLGAG